VNLGLIVFNKVRRVVTRHGTLTSMVAFVLLSSVVLALTLPLNVPEVSDPDRAEAVAINAGKPRTEENLEQFLRGTRWGISLAQVRHANSAETDQQPAQSQEIGFLGIVESKGEARVVLRMEDGAVDTRDLGETLPDGRQLDSLGETTLSLKRDNTEVEELLLFPEVTSSDLEPKQVTEPTGESTDETVSYPTEIDPDRVTEGTIPE